jgi:hypothetical protein
MGLPAEGGRITIYSQQGEQRIPALTVQRLEDSALGTEKLAANVVSLLNGKTPGHTLDAGDGHHVYYQRTPTGIILHDHDGVPGLSRPVIGLLGVGQDGVLTTEAHTALDAADNLFMKALGDTVLRAVHGPSGSGPRPQTPQP